MVLPTFISGRPNFVSEWCRCGDDQPTYISGRPNFVSEVVRCGASQKRPPKDSTLRYSLGRFAFSDVPQIAAYHTKLLEDAKFLTNLNKSLNATIELLCCVTCRNLNTDTSLALWYYGVVETCYEYTLLLELCCEVL